jgi:hypothetical protein
MILSNERQKQFEEEEDDNINCYQRMERKERY